MAAIAHAHSSRPNIIPVKKPKMPKNVDLFNNKDAILLLQCLVVHKTSLTAKCGHFGSHFDQNLGGKFYILNP
jgi:hypothetical protein